MLVKYAADLLASYVPIAKEELAVRLELPPKPEMGDVAFPCFTLSKQLKQSPQTIAGRLAEAVNAAGQGVRAAAAGGYLNLFFDPAYWSPRILEAALSGNYGSFDAEERGRHVVIDLSSPNIAKPMSIGHLRSTVIGNALANLYRKAGCRVTKVNHIGDWGTQFGKLIAAYGRWGDRERLEADPIKESLRLYVKFHEEADTHPELEDEGREKFRMLEQGDEESLALWRFFIDVSLLEFNRIYDRLGVTFDYVLGESFYNDKMGAVARRLKDLSLLEESDGAQVVRLDEEQMPPCLIRKSDGTTIYPTRDLASALYRKHEMKADEILYVVGGEQSLHFRQVFAVLRKMGEQWADQCRHIAFGLMRFGGRKMSTRKGTVVFLEEVLNEAVRKASEILEAKSPDLPNEREVAEAIGVGAVVFGDLKNRRMHSVDFELEEALSFDGETGPYLQYTYARTLSLLRKGDYEGLKQRTADGGKAGKRISADGAWPATPAAWTCIKTVSRFEHALREALRENEPSVVARYLLETAKDFNRFYNEGKIIVPNEEETFAKLQLAAAVAKLLGEGLRLLGIRTPEQL